MDVRGDHESCREFDLLTLSGMLKICDMDMVLLNAAKPRAACHSVFHDDAFFCSGRTAFPFRGSFSLPAEWAMLVCVHEVSLRSWCHGIGLAPGTALTVLPEGTSEFMIEAGMRFSFVLVPIARVRAVFSRLAPPDAELPTHRLRMFAVGSQAAGERLRQSYESIRRQVGEAGDVPEGPVDELIENHLRAAMASTTDDLKTRSRSRRTHYLALRRAENFMRANLRRDIYIQELCNAAGASERSLRYAFDDLLGISPNRFLSMLRLCVAYRSLVQADASRRSVKSIALSCGMWDLSRFAEHYRHLFGELPRATLTRSHALSGDTEFDDT
jgi:AraC family ethanolamine operon transcriptional activator